MAYARTNRIPAHDSDALRIGPAALPLVWRDHYVVASIDDVPTETARALADKGFEVVHFGPSDETWSEAFARLGAALGAT